jgi:hypothetical protein
VQIETDAMEGNGVLNGDVRENYVGQEDNIKMDLKQI